jgi:hypothetical protein
MKIEHTQHILHHDSKATWRFDSVNCKENTTTSTCHNSQHENNNNNNIDVTTLTMPKAKKWIPEEYATLAKAWVQTSEEVDVKVLKGTSQTGGQF